jgi:hypothetical protein
MKTSIFSGSLTAIALLSASLLQAQLINVDFNGNSVGVDYGGGGVATGPTMTGAAVLGAAGDQWNGIADSAYAFSAYPNGINSTALPLMNSAGINTSVTMTIATDGGSYDANEPNWGNTSAFTTAGSPYSNLMQDLIYANKSGTITLSGLAASATYQLVLYNAGDQNVGAGRASAFTVNGVTQTSVWNGTSATLTAGLSYVDFASAMSDGSGNLVITFGPGSIGGVLSSEGDLDGFQIMAAGVPEPASLALLGVAGMMFFGWRRRLARA